MPLTRLPLGTGVSGTLPVGNGGTNVTTAADLANTGNLVKISTATASADTSIEFDVDGTYDHYIFRLSKIHISADTDDMKVDFSLTSDTDYNDATHTYILRRMTQSESSGSDISAQESASTGTLSYTHIAGNISADNDHCFDGTLELYNPSSTTFTKGVSGNFTFMRADNKVCSVELVGDIRNTAAVDKVKFLMVSGNFASGTITQYGVKT